MATREMTAAGRSTWSIDTEHTNVGFSVRHMMITTVRGQFAGVSGTVELDEVDVTRSTANVQIEAATVDTRSGQRDEHLRSADFFDVVSHPRITFESRSVRHVGENLQVEGDLTIRGVTRAVTLDVTEEGRGRDPWGGERIAFRAETKIDRTDYGLTWNQALEAGGVLVSDEVKLVLEVQAVRSEG